MNRYLLIAITHIFLEDITHIWWTNWMKKLPASSCDRCNICVTGGLLTYGLGPFAKQTLLAERPTEDVDDLILKRKKEDVDDFI